MSPHSKPPAPVILVAALDWGLGHATRCLPIIRRLVDRGVAVRLAGTGASGALLREAFPQLPYNEIPGHLVRYSKKGRWLLWKILLQLPRLTRSVESEHSWLRQLLQQETVDAVISDNRYGLWSRSVPTVIITHQLELRTPFGAIGNRLLRPFHYRLLRRFSQCWIPDGPAPGLAGALAHPAVMPSVPARFIGPLSRFARKENPQTIDLAVVLSGPEPQRTIWEQLLLPQLKAFPGTALLVRGLPGAEKMLTGTERLTIVNHLPAAALEGALTGAQIILARSGYSTVMDLAALGKRSILVPTPGQPEQEYLAKHLTTTGFALCTKQEDFELEVTLKAAASFHYQLPPPPDGKALDDAIDDLLGRIEKTKRNQDLRYAER